MVKMLLDKGVDPNIVAWSTKQNALEIATEKGFTEISKLLEPVTVPVGIPDSYEDWEWEDP